MFENGLQQLLIRKPSWPADRWRGLFESIAPKHRNRVGISGHTSLAKDLGAQWLHAEGTADLDPLFFTSGAQHSLLVSDFDQLLSLDARLSHVQLYPCFEHTSIDGFKCHFDEALLKEHFSRKLSPVKVFAAGGITPIRANYCKEIGFDGVVLMEAIWNAQREGGMPSVEQVWQEMMKIEN